MELNEEQRRIVRAAARERKRKQRERDKLKRVRALEAQQAAADRAERRRRNLYFYGESRPGRNADSFADELQIHREFLRGLNQPDVQPGETLRDVARRVYQAWASGPLSSRGRGTTYVPGFNRALQTFDVEYGFVIGNEAFDAVWSPPKECIDDKPIDVDDLPKLPNLPTIPMKEEPAREEPTEPPPAQTAAVSMEAPNSISFTWVHPSASRFMDGR